MYKMDINNTELEKALSEGENKSQAEEKKTPQMPKEMEIGFHQGALNTLAAEKSALFEMIQKVDVFMQGHIKRLEELGVKVEKRQK